MFQATGVVVGGTETRKIASGWFPGHFVVSVPIMSVQRSENRIVLGSFSQVGEMSSSEVVEESRGERTTEVEVVSEGFLE